MAPEAANPSQVESPPATAMWLALIGGLIIILGDVILIILIAIGTGFNGMGMFDYHQMMNGMGFESNAMYFFATIGLVCGFVVVIGAAMLGARPEQSSTWGILIIVFSFLSLIGWGGFLVGTALGVVGGVIALAWKPSAGAKPQ